MTKRAQYITILKPSRIEMMVDGGTEEEQAIVSQHFDYLKGLTEEGTAILMGRTQETIENTIGIVVFKAKSEQEATKLMNDDPAVKHGVMRGSLYRFRIALFNPAGVDL